MPDYECDIQSGDDGVIPYLPTPEEIELRTAEIRKHWTDAERWKRAGFEVVAMEVEMIQRINHRSGQGTSE